MEITIKMDGVGKEMSNQREGFIMQFYECVSCGCRNIIHKGEPSPFCPICGSYEILKQRSKNTMEITIHTGMMGDASKINIEWFNGNLETQHTEILAKVKNQDKPRVLEIYVDGVKVSDISDAHPAITHGIVEPLTKRPL